MTTPDARILRAFGGLTDTHVGERRQLQARLAFLGRTGFMIAVAFLAISISHFCIGTGDSLGAWLADPDRRLLLLEPLPFGVLWILVRNGTPSLARLRLLDAAATIAIIGIAVIGSRHSEFSVSAGGAVLVCMAALIFRAVVVPASAWWTALTCAVAVGPMVVSLLFPPDIWHLTRSGSLDELRITIRTYLIWVVVSVVLATLTSRVIYGLRRRISSVAKLGQYRLEEKLGAGGMGEVYRASHALLRRPTAIKLLRPECAGEESLLRFEREVQQTARLTHPNTVAIYDYGRTHEGIFYYAMEFLEGFDLHRLVGMAGPLAPARAVHILRQVCSSLAEAHGAGLIHRDIKPANIILTHRGGIYDFVKVVDFGIAKILDPGAETGLTKEAVLMGTPGYIAPELLRSPSHAGPASDIYALGATAYFLVTGTNVFSGESVMEICSHHMHSIPEPPSARRPGEIPPALERLILQCLAKDPKERPGSVADLQVAFGVLTSIDPWSEQDARRCWAEHRVAHAGSAPSTFREDLGLVVTEELPRSASSQERQPATS